MRISVDGGSRARLVWWLVVLALGVAFAYVLYSFIGTFVLGIFAYYASRPAYRRMRTHFDSDRKAAAVTGLGIVLPLIAFFVYSGFAIAGELLTQPTSDSLKELLYSALGLGGLSDAQRDVAIELIENPVRALSERRGAVRGLLTSGMDLLNVAGLWVLHVGLALTLAFYLLRDDDEIADIFERTVGGTDTTAYAYATAVDRDLKVIFYGNVLFVLVVGVLAAIVYWGANFFAPPGISVPLPFVLAALTGLSSLIPILVSKVVYVPLVAYLGFQAARSDASFAFPIGLLVVSLLVLDLFPQLVIQPYITGRKITMGLMLFAYLLGPLLFGWYGVFLLPMLLVFGVQALRIVFEELVHGESLTPQVVIEHSIGSDPATDPAGGEAED